MRHRHRLAISLGILAFTSPVIAADAADAADAAGSRSDDGAKAETPASLAAVVVSGERSRAPEVAGRLGLSDRETPAVVEVITREDIETQGLRTAIDALNAAPGVASGNLPGSVGALSVRGFHRAVNYLYDGVRLANSDVGVRNWDSWNYERVEVIKGPASVTSGEGALAGAVNFVPRSAVLGKTFGELFSSYGSQNSLRVAGDVNQPLGDKAAGRADFSYSRSSGWIDDTDSATFGGLVSVRIEPTERLSIALSADYYKDSFQTAYYGTPLVGAGTARRPSGLVSGSAGYVLDRANRRSNYDTTDGALGTETLWLRARADYKLGDHWRLVSDSTWYTADRSYVDSDDYSFNFNTGLLDRSTTIITHDHEVWSQRLHAAFDGALFCHRNRFTIGGEAAGTDFFTRRRFGSTTSVDPYDYARGTFPDDNAANFSTRQNVTAEVESQALFVENAFNLTDKLLLVGGARLDLFQLSRRVVNATSGALSTYGQDYDPISWRLGAVYDLLPRTQLFAQYTKAATPVSGLLFLSASNARFKVSTGDSYELGIKTSQFGERLQLTASVYQIEQDDILTRDPQNPQLTLQGGTQRSRGIELSADLLISRELTLAVGGTLIDPEFRKLVEAGGADRAGNRPVNTSKQLADVVLTYAPQALPLSFTGIVRHNGNFFTNNANTVKVDGYTVVDAAITWKAPGRNTVTLRGRNLTDALYADWSGYSSYLLFLGQPRSVEVSLGHSF